VYDGSRTGKKEEIRDFTHTIENLNNTALSAWFITFDPFSKVMAEFMASALQQHSSQFESSDQTLLSI
jgi:hypothetical protein